MSVSSPKSPSETLTRFLHKNRRKVPADILNREADSSDDFETPVKKVKTALKPSQRVQPTAGATKAKRKTTRKRSKQPNIKSALLRTEQMFSELAAQHTLIDNFNPDDIQMALVISRSEVETCKISDIHIDHFAGAREPAKEDCAKSIEEDIHSTLQKYGFRTAAKRDYANCFATALSTAHRRGKTKWGNKFTALTLRDAEIQAKKLNEKIQALLAQQHSLCKKSEDSAGDFSNAQYKIQSLFLQRQFTLMPKDRFFRDAELFTIAEHLDRFFIEELFPVTHLPAGHLLKDWTIIAGRDASPQRHKRNRPSVQEKKFENFYNELQGKRLLAESNESNIADGNNVESCENVSMLVVPGSQINCVSGKELDGLPDVIAKTQNVELIKAEAVEEEKINQTPSPMTITSSIDTNNFGSGSVLTNTPMRCTSPDLFAESDSDCGDLVEVNNLNNITTLEIFSSDEEKNCLNAGNVSQDSLSMKPCDVKLTDVDIDKRGHIDKCASVESSTTCENEIVNRLVEFEKNTFRNASQTDAQDFNDYISNDLAGTIDLTQSDEEHFRGNDSNDRGDTDSDCILLSDDEVNYSILKANKVANKKRTKLSQANENAHNFSVLEFVEDDESCLVGNKNKSFCKKQTFDLSSDAEPVKAHYLSVMKDQEYENELKSTHTVTPTKSASRLEHFERNGSVELNSTVAEIFTMPALYTTPTKDSNTSALLKAQRAEFGILESQSEPFSQTPPHSQHTPAKTNSPLSTHESSLCTAADFVSGARRSNEKFNSFLQSSQDLGVQQLDHFDDFDEFDRLVYGDPLPKEMTVSKPTAEGVPAGFSQLLTGEISFNAPFECSFSPNPKPSTNAVEVCKMKTPEKVEEITINKHVYLVRKTCMSKPNFELQSESEILKQLYEFGIKPLKRKQAIKLLEYIYNETHPVIVPAISESNTTELVTATKSQPTSTSVYISKSEALRTQSIVETMKRTQSTLSLTVARKFNFQDCCGAVFLRFSQELFAEMCNDEEIYLFQTNLSKKTQQPLVPLHIAWFNLVCSSQELHESILMYEPIDLQEVYMFFKQLGYRYDPKDLKSFFDRRCIIFRYDLTAPEKQKDRHVRKPKKYK